MCALCHGNCCFCVRAPLHHLCQGPCHALTAIALATTVNPLGQATCIPEQQRPPCAVFHLGQTLHYNHDLPRHADARTGCYSWCRAPTPLGHPLQPVLEPRSCRPPSSATGTGSVSPQDSTSACLLRPPRPTHPTHAGAPPARSTQSCRQPASNAQVIYKTVNASGAQGSCARCLDQLGKGPRRSLLLAPTPHPAPPPHRHTHIRMRTPARTA